MIPAETLRKLVPNRVPSPDFPFNPVLSTEDPTRLIASWSAYLRDKIYQQLSINTTLAQMIDSSGFVATGVFHAPSDRTHEGSRDFPVVNGYQFGAALLRAQFIRHTQGSYLDDIVLEPDLLAPLVQLVARFTPQRGSPDGYVAALFKDSDQRVCGITAAHIVTNYGKGQTVPIWCRACEKSAKLSRVAVGCIDAAVVEYRCWGPGHKMPIRGRDRAARVRAAREGETVQAHFGDTGTQRLTVAMALQSATEIKSAALPKNFLISDHGHPGDSGSLICSDHRQPHRELIGLYLGKSDCLDQNQHHVTYGYALELKQAADMLDANYLWGDFNE